MSEFERIIEEYKEKLREVYNEELRGLQEASQKLIERAASEVDNVKDKLVKSFKL